MSHKTKLVLKMVREKFEIVKTVNTISYGLPGIRLSTSDVTNLIDSNFFKIDTGDLTVEIIGSD